MGGTARVLSPAPGFSTLMTFAPSSISSVEQKGPASTWGRSITVIPSRGRGGGMGISRRQGRNVAKGLFWRQKRPAGAAKMLQEDKRRNVGK
ncbi:hypothetical protein [Phaeovulum vinaykumarii]